MSKKFPRFSIPREVKAKAQGMFLFPFVKHDIFTRHYKVQAKMERQVYYTYRMLAKNNPLVSLDELQLETGYPMKVVISAVQQLNSGGHPLLQIVPTRLTEFVIGGEYDLNEIKPLVKQMLEKDSYEAVGVPDFGIIQNILAFLKRKGVDIDKAPEYSEPDDLDISEDEIPF